MGDRYSDLKDIYGEEWEMRAVDVAGEGGGHGGRK